MGKYKSTIKSLSFLHLELKKASELRLEGFNDKEIKERIREDNIFMLKSDNRKRAIASEIVARLSQLDEALMEMITTKHSSIGKLITLYSIMKKDQLFLAFMQEVYRDKLILGDHRVTAKDFNLFYQGKREQEEVMGTWTDYTYKKLTQVYKRILVEAGLAKRVNKDIEIQPAIIDYDLEESIKAVGDEDYVKILQGVRQ
ncbi:DUF1819 family protein [Isachenkonia alkalipeptolytica]|uniref:DUF1819 family protein n=1 Tax=Isachenkonia alkalipeptolytica TaxID=2565777 RepID=A0AA44BCU7_9CLOT|nr:DUF1819 family protein [Isachenkonia alkalipeptolytica]NBG87674.1 DUF1819 family protein [Isachenkonia alkalipeptolytica]